MRVTTRAMIIRFDFLEGQPDFFNHRSIASVVQIALVSFANPFFKCFARRRFRTKDGLFSSTALSRTGVSLSPYLWTAIDAILAQREALEFFAATSTDAFLGLIAGGVIGLFLSFTRFDFLFADYFFATLPAVLCELVPVKFSSAANTSLSHVHSPKLLLSVALTIAPVGRRTRSPS